MTPAPLGKQAQKKRGPSLAAGTGFFRGLTDSKWQTRTYAITSSLTIHLSRSPDIWHPSNPSPRVSITQEYMVRRHRRR